MQPHQNFNNKIPNEYQDETIKQKNDIKIEKDQEAFNNTYHNEGEIPTHEYSILGHSVSPKDSSTHKLPPNILEVISENIASLNSNIAALTTTVSNLTISVATSQAELKSLSEIVSQWDTKLDLFAQIMESSNQEPKINEINVESKVKTVEGLHDLEIRLNDEHFMNQMIEHLERVVGYNRLGLSSQKVFSNVLDAIVERDVLTNFSWTGRGRKGEKQNFQIHKNILNVIFQTVLLTDENYTIAENDKYMHQVLRNSVSRCNQVAELKRKGLIEPTDTKRKPEAIMSNCGKILSDIKEEVILD